MKYYEGSLSNGENIYKLQKKLSTILKNKNNT